MLIYLLLFFLGCFFGSFLNLLIDRLPKGEDVLFSRSHCDKCKKTLAWYDLIPVISFLLLRGKCRYCGVKLSFFYPFMEISTGFLFVFNYHWLLHAYLIPGTQAQFFLALIIYTLISSLLLVIFFIDFRFGIIPNKILIALLILIGIYQLIFGINNFPLHIMTGLISFAFFIFLTLITKGRGMGFGDTKFSFVMGLMLGYPGFILGLYIAFLTGAIVGVILILWGKKRFKKDTIAFGPFMVLGTIAAFYFGNILLPIFLPFLIP